jgi:hypothetical protein
MCWDGSRPFISGASRLGSRDSRRLPVRRRPPWRDCSGFRTRRGRPWSRTCRRTAPARHASTMAGDLRHIHMLKCVRRQDVPAAYGPPTTIYNRRNRWSRHGLWRRILAALAELGCLDSTYMKAHRSAHGATNPNLSIGIEYGPRIRGVRRPIGTLGRRVHIGFREDTGAGVGMLVVETIAKIRRAFSSKRSRSR